MVCAVFLEVCQPWPSWTAGFLAQPPFYQYRHKLRAPVAAGMTPAAHGSLLVLGLDVAAAMQGLEAAVGAASLTTEKLESLAEMAVGVAAFAVLQTAETAKQAGKVGLGATVMGVEKAEQVGNFESCRMNSVWDVLPLLLLRPSTWQSRAKGLVLPSRES